MTTGGKAQSVYVVTDADILAGRFRVQPGPAVKVVGITPETRGVEGGPSIPVYIVSDPTVRGVTGGNAIPVSNLMGTRAPIHDLAIPIYVTEDDGQFTTPGSLHTLLRSYNFIGASSREDGYVNLADPGNGDAVSKEDEGPDSDPDWTIQKGLHWYSGAGFSMLTTGLVYSGEDWTLLARVSEVQDSSGAIMGARNDLGGLGFVPYVYEDSGDTVGGWYGLEFISADSAGAQDESVVGMTSDGIYADGILIASFVDPVSPFIADEPISVGGVGGDHYLGKLQAARIYNWKLDAAEIATASAELAALQAPYLTRKMVGYWSMDEGSGFPANKVNTALTFDYSGGNQPSSAAGKVGNARHFDGGGTTFWAATDNLFSVFDTLTQSFSVGFWFKCGNPGFAGGPVSLDGGGGANRSWSFFLLGGSLYSQVYDGPVSGPSVNTPYTANVWNLAMFKLDHTTQKIYQSVNGGNWDESSGTMAGAMQVNAAWVLYCGIVQGNLYTGDVDELMYLIDYAWTDDDKTFLWNGGAGRSFADIHGYTG